MMAGDADYRGPEAGGGLHPDRVTSPHPLPRISLTMTGDDCRGQRVVDRDCQHEN